MNNREVEFVKDARHNLNRYCVLDAHTGEHVKYTVLEKNITPGQFYMVADDGYYYPIENPK